MHLCCCREYFIYVLFTITGRAELQKVFLATMLLCSNKAAILEKGGGNIRQSWGPLLKGIGSMFTDTTGQALVDSVWADIKVSLPLL